MSREFLRAEHSPQRPHCVADDAVSCELVSAPNSLLTGKLTGNFAESDPSTQILASDQHADPIAYSGIPYTTEQGISERISGKRFQVTGNFHLDHWYPKPRHAPMA